ncbi:MAG: hypothetical protein ACOZCO_08750 [Bacteroidota bacterium]
MDNIKEIISTLSNADRNEFRKFLARQKKFSNRKDLELFDLLSSGKEFQKPTRKKTGKHEADAYHALRKRLAEQLADFIVLKNIEEDVSGRGKITGMISLCRYLFNVEMPDTAWKYLRKAEHLAEEVSNHELLISIYLLMAEQSHLNAELSLKQLEAKIAISRRQLEEEGKLTLATAVIRKKLEETKHSVKLSEFPGFVEQTLTRFGLSDAILENPAHLYRLLEIVRSTYLALRNLKNFEPFMMEQFLKYEKNIKPEKQNHFYHLQMLYMVAHVLYRTRKFSQSKKYLTEMHRSLSKYNKQFSGHFYPKYISLISSIESLSGKNDIAIQLHEEFLKQRKFRINTSDELNMQLNLAFFYFNAGEYKKANRIFVNMDHSDNWYEKKMGKEWVIRKELIRVTVQYELGHEDISLSILKNLKKEYSELLRHPQYAKAANFMNFIELFINDPYALSFKEFRKKAEKDLFDVPVEAEESKAIAFYCWLKSKLTGKNYYETLLEEVKASSDLV